MPSYSRTATAMPNSNPYKAPAQHGQPSRKGKRAWRKHVDILPVEVALEDIRAQERITGSAVHAKSNADLFKVDVTGDAAVKASLKRFDRTQLKSARILALRSAVPAVAGRASQPTTAVTRKEKERLLRLAKLKRQNPLDSHVAKLGLGDGSTPLEPSRAVKESGTYDVWSTPNAGFDFLELEPQAQDFIADIVHKRKVKAPHTSQMHKQIRLAPVASPRDGVSYNPPESAHRELLVQAVAAEELRIAASKKFEDVKASIDAARHIDQGTVGPAGMLIDLPAADAPDAAEDGDADGDVVAVPAKPARRKTDQQRRKAAKVHAEKQVLAQRAARKQLRVQLDRLKAIRVASRATVATHAVKMALREAARTQKLRDGLAGQRLGKHRVSEGQIDVQLGEELSESLRGLKPEGNLFRDRLLSLQQRALVEPRVRVLPRRRKLKIKDYELHAWKNFKV